MTYVRLARNSRANTASLDDPVVATFWAAPAARIVLGFLFIAGYPLSSEYGNQWRYCGAIVLFFRVAQTCAERESPEGSNLSSKIGSIGQCFRFFPKRDLNQCCARQSPLDLLPHGKARRTKRVLQLGLTPMPYKNASKGGISARTARGRVRFEEPQEPVAGRLRPVPLKYCESACSLNPPPAVDSSTSSPKWPF